MAPTPEQMRAAHPMLASSNYRRWREAKAARDIVQRILSPLRGCLWLPGRAAPDARRQAPISGRDADTCRRPSKSTGQRQRTRIC